VLPCYTPFSDNSLFVDAHFLQKGPMAEEAQQYQRDGERK